MSVPVTTTTIQLSKEIKKTLESMKLHPRETYEEVLDRILEDLRELSEQTKRKSSRRSARSREVSIGPMNSSGPRWATDALRNHLVRFGRRSVEEARSNRRASNLRQSRRTARDATSVCPEACQLALLPASSRRLSRHPGHPRNRSPDPSAKGGASKIDPLTERS